MPYNILLRKSIIFRQERFSEIGLKDGPLAEILSSAKQLGLQVEYLLQAVVASKLLYDAFLFWLLKGTRYRHTCTVLCHNLPFHLAQRDMMHEPMVRKEEVHGNTVNELAVANFLKTGNYITSRTV